MKRKPINLFQLSWQEFERLCADILRLRGLRNVKIQGKNCPAFDIIANELLDSVLMSSWIRWGVQCKRERKNVKPRVLDDVLTEARMRDISSVLVISASDFSDRTIRAGELLEKRHPELLKVDFWNEHKVRRYLARYPPLLEKYFNIDVVAMLQDISTPDLLVEYLAQVSGAPITRLEDLLVDSDINRFALKTERAYYSGGAELPVAEVLDRYKGQERKYLEVVEQVGILEAYDEFIELEHITTLSNLPRSPRSAVWKEYQKLTDVVRSRVVLNEPSGFRFLFTRRQKDWDVSHVLQHNEYTWLLGSPITDLRRVDKFIKVKNMFVNGYKLRCLQRKVERNKIIILMGAKSLKKKWGKEAQIRYTVVSLHPRDACSMFSSTHAPAQSYRFTLTSSEGFHKKPVVNAFFGGVQTLPDITYYPEDDPSSVVVRAVGPLPQRAGIAINW